jgi:hypothetical protein
MRPRPRPAGPDLGPPPPPMATARRRRAAPAGQKPEAAPPPRRRSAFTAPWSGHRAAAPDEKHGTPADRAGPRHHSHAGEREAPPPPAPRGFARRRPLAAAREGRGEEGLELGKARVSPCARGSDRTKRFRVC